MKKLYAKTSFATKKSQKQTKLSAVELDNNNENKHALHKYPSPILAFNQSEIENNYGFMGSGDNYGGGVGETATINKTPKMPRTVRKDAELSLPPPRPLSPQISLSSLPANLTYNSSSPHEKEETTTTTTTPTTNYYYSITEVEHLPMLDHRHINWQQEQRARQQEWRRRRLTQTPVLTAPLTPFHQHQKMILQLPLAVNNNVVVNGKEMSMDTKNTKIASPIYEQPQIVTAVSQITTNNVSATIAVNKNEEDIGNTFSSLPHDVSAASSSSSPSGAVKGDALETVGSLNSSRRLWNSQQNDGHNNHYTNNNHNNNNNYKENDDKCLTTTTAIKTSLHHSQSLPSIRLNGNTSTATMSAVHNLNFYQQLKQVF